MHDTPPAPANTNIMSYADDFTITSTHNSIPTATALLQDYLNTLQTWFDTNRLKVAPTKSTVTLITNYTKEHQHTPQLTLDNTAIPHKHTTKILGVTYDTSLSFKDHIHDIKQKCTPRLNTLRTLTGTDFGQHIKKLWRLYTNNTSVRFWNTPVRLGLQTLQQLTTTPCKLYRTTLYESSLAAHKLHQ